MPDFMYQQIADEVRRKIESGQLRHGAQIPTELELMTQHKASRNTVRDAVKLLVARGLVETRRGQGAFVLGKIDPYVTILTGDPAKGSDEKGPVYSAAAHKEPRKLTVTEPEVKIKKAAGAKVEELWITDDESVVSRHQRRYIDDIPWSLQTTFYPMAFAQRGAGDLLQAEDIRGGAVEYLHSALGIKQFGYHDKIKVRVPDADETRFFKLPDDGRVAVFEVRRTAFDQRGQPFRLTVSIFPADRNEFAVNVGRIPDEVAAPELVYLEGASLPKIAAPMGNG